MTPDTWGIPGPAFIGYYAGATVLLVILSTVHRRRLLGGKPDAIAGLGPQQIAYLSGRDRLAVYTSLGGLRAADAIGTGDDKTLRQTGPLPAGGSALDTAVYNAAGRRIPAKEVVTDQWVVAALADLRADLESRGLATTRSQRLGARLWVLPGLALIGVGIARWAAGSANGKPIGFLIAAVLVACVVTIVIGIKSERTTTRAAADGIARLRYDNKYLSPRQSPAYATYGPSGAALGVALFGAASLYEMDPAFAAEAEIQQAGAPIWSSGGSASSCSAGSSSCGGGGGSSCGGGGGGGGCGG
jgi:uncharacterized protein (TIGR04222 family)